MPGHPSRGPLALRSDDFERVLRAPLRARSQHFALHFVAGRPLTRKTAVVPELSTGAAPTVVKPVDDLPEACWLGSVVPKRHARRAVTRNLLKRQIRAAWQRHGERLPGGLWVVRLRQGFDARQFPSAASDALRNLVRSELDGMLAHAAAA